MFFDIIPNLLATILTVLFPIFASYKALSSSDPAQLAPWLIYFVCLALFTLVESYLYIIPWLPFYAWARLGLYIWLLLPGESQGATFVYRRYIAPFFAEHEAEIEDFISTSHERARGFGLDALKRLIDYVRANVLGQPPPPPPPAATAPAHANYAQNLMSRFALPSARANFASSLGSPSSLLGAALQQATGGTRRDVDQHAGGTPSVAQLLEQLRQMQQEKEHLTRQLQDRSAGLHAPPSLSPEPSIKSVGSEAEFDTISHEDAASGKDQRTGGAWGSWPFGGNRKTSGTRAVSGGGGEHATGSSSGVDVRR